MDIKTIKVGGVMVKSDYGLYTKDNEMVLLSVYGALQQVQAVFAAVAGFKSVTVVPDGINVQRSNSSLRARGRPIGYGKRHLLMWDADAAGRSIIWMNGAEDKEKAIEGFLSSRKVPYEKDFFHHFEKRLLEDELMERMTGWGDVSGYAVLEEDDGRLCDVMLDIAASVGGGFCTTQSNMTGERALQGYAS